MESVALADLEARALSAQPMIRMQARAVAQAEANVRLAGRERYPDFTIGAEYMANRDMPDTWTGMLGLNIPIRRGSLYGPKIREAREHKAAVEADLAQAQIETAAMVRETAAMLRGARAMVNLYRMTVIPRAEQSLEATRAAYQTDRVEFLDLLDGHRTLLEFRMMAEEAIAEYLASRAQLDLAVGEMAGIPGAALRDEGLNRIGDDDDR
jgi:outer membrane protein TolC